VLRYGRDDDRVGLQSRAVDRQIERVSGTGSEHPEPSGAEGGAGGPSFPGPLRHLHPFRAAPGSAAGDGGEPESEAGKSAQDQREEYASYGQDQAGYH
jgi:hypothetical protein